MNATAMNVVRLAISAFLLLLIVIAARGLIWTASHQPPAQSAASRVVLTLSIVAGLVGLWSLWKRRATH